MDPVIPNDKLSAIKEFLHGGNKIEAIKLYRLITGSSLADAKKATEILEAESRATSPEKFVQQSARSGCFGMISAGIAVIGSLVWNIARWA